MAAASRNQQVLKQAKRLFTPRKMENRLASNPNEDFDESDIFSYQPEPDNPLRFPAPVSRPKWQTPNVESAPVRISDWSKMSRSCCNNSDELSEVFLSRPEPDNPLRSPMEPPHEVMMRRRAASLSVVEGAGRTLKGRDLSRVRNDIWAQTGFQD